MLEFFIQFANNNSKCKISDQYLQDMNNIIINHLSIMGQVFKLIWDIEKDWNIDPLSVRPECQLHLKKKGHSYPIYDDYFYLFANNSTIDGIKIPLQVYKQKSDSNTPKTFNRNLEEKLIQFLIDNHGAIKSRKAASGYWGMFYEHGKHLMDSFPITKDNLYDILVIKSFETAPYVKMQFRDDKVVAALNYFYYEGLYFHPYGIRQFVLNRLGSNIAK